MRPFSLFLRGVTCAFAALLGALAVWVIVAQFLSPRLGYFPANQSEAATWSAAQSSATAAAISGKVRGDLWTVAAIAKAAPLLYDARSDRPQDTSRNQAEDARSTAERAAKLSPHDSRAWLVLAALDVRLGESGSKTNDALKLSYYTAPSELAVMPLRLRVAVQSDATADEELQTLVRTEIQHMLADLKPAIARAYEDARPEGRKFIEAALTQADPKFLAMLPARSQ